MRTHTHTYIRTQNEQNFEEFFLYAWLKYSDNIEKSMMGLILYTLGNLFMASLYLFEVSQWERRLGNGLGV